MKTLLTVVLLCLIHSVLLYAQTETYSDSKSSSYAMVSGRVPIGKIPVDVYVKNTLKKKSSRGSKKENLKSLWIIRNA